jgi:hypothetical protein
MVQTALYLVHHAPMPVPNPEEAGVENDLVSIFFKLTETHYVGNEPRDEVDTR